MLNRCLVHQATQNNETTPLTDALHHAQLPKHHVAHKKDAVSQSPPQLNPRPALATPRRTSHRTHVNDDELSLLPFSGPTCGEEDREAEATCQAADSDHLHRRGSGELQGSGSADDWAQVWGCWAWDGD